jgi:hypothetical protein
MAKVLILAPSQYLQGQVNLFQGDQWSVTGQIVDQYNGVSVPTNLTGAQGVTAYFPGVAGVAVQVPATISDASQGIVTISVSPTVSQTVLSSEGSSFYVQVSGLIAGGLVTVPTFDQPLVVTAPTFIA